MNSYNYMQLNFSKVQYFEIPAKCKLKSFAKVLQTYCVHIYTYCSLFFYIKNIHKTELKNGTDIEQYPTSQAHKIFTNLVHFKIAAQQTNAKLSQEQTKYTHTCKGEFPCNNPAVFYTVCIGTMYIVYTIIKINTHTRATSNDYQLLTTTPYCVHSKK